MFRFNKAYFIWMLTLLAAEIFIGVFMHDSIIRPYGGDFLVVILIYCFVKSFTTWATKTACIAVLLFAYLIEVLQYFKLLVHLGLKNSTMAKLILGNAFSWTDMLMYTLGILFVAYAERAASAKRAKKALTAFAE
ncbi:MAG TPA: DUF2809 domain-containing protein [Chitinophagaceae bacterium]|nr:DUF2809 domain-containing protein [Chitinophagaceae bacterium]